VAMSHLVAKHRGGESERSATSVLSVTGRRRAETSNILI
jgi:hypothetical protein